MITPDAQGGKEGYAVRAEVINVSREAVALRAVHWRSWGHEGGFDAYVEAALSIESYPAFEPCRAQVFVGRDVAEPEYMLKAGKALSVKWHATGRHLKNIVSDPSEVQNPEFTENGLYSVHGSITLAVADRPVRLRSNEQLVSIGGSREAPKHTYGQLTWVDEKRKTATLRLGLLDKVAEGDQFRIDSMYKGPIWTLTITEVRMEYSSGNLVESPTGNLVQSDVIPNGNFLSRGDYAALISKQ